MHNFIPKVFQKFGIVLTVLKTGVMSLTIQHQYFIDQLDTLSKTGHTAYQLKKLSDLFYSAVHGNDSVETLERVYPLIKQIRLNDRQVSIVQEMIRCFGVGTKDSYAIKLFNTFLPLPEILHDLCDEIFAIKSEWSKFNILMHFDLLLPEIKNQVLKLVEGKISKNEVVNFLNLLNSKSERIEKKVANTSLAKLNQRVKQVVDAVIIAAINKFSVNLHDIKFNISNNTFKLFNKRVVYNSTRKNPPNNLDLHTINFSIGNKFSHLQLNNCSLTDNELIIINNFNQLEFLDLSNHPHENKHNIFTTFKVSLEKTKLKTLILSHTRIKNFSLEAVPPTLVKLDLSHNKLDENKFSIQKPNNVKHLILSSNKFTKTSTLFNLYPSTIQLELSNNEIHKIHNTINNLKNLHTLNLSNNYIKNLPNIKLTSLKILNIDYNIIEELPKIFITPQLETFSAKRNEFSKFPGQILEQGSLLHLNFAFNKLISLPPLNNLSKLNRVNFKSNRLTNINNTFDSNCKIQLLNLSNNYIKKIPSILSKLNELVIIKINNNNIKRLEDNLNANSKITKLVISNNRLKIFPLDICNIQNIKHLNLSNTRIKSIPQEINKLPFITYLNISHSKIEFLPESLSGLKMIRTLLLNNNKLNSFSKCLTELGTLKTLNLEHNNIESIPDGIRKLVLLENFSIDDNPINTIAPVLADMEKISSIGSCKKIKSMFNQIKKKYNYKKFEIGLSIVIKTTKNQIQSDYKFILQNLGLQLHDEVSNVLVKYTDSKSIDGGGLKRDFFTLVFQRFLKNHVHKGWPLPPKLDDVFLYISVGKIIAFACRTRLPLGPIFHPDIYDILCSCPDEVKDIPLEKLGIDEILQLVSKEYIKSMKLIKVLQFCQCSDIEEANTYIKGFKELYQSLFLDFPDEYLDAKGNILTKKFELLKKSVHDEMVKYHIDIAAPVYYILQGFSLIAPVWRNRKHIFQMQEKAEGSLDVTMFINSLEIADSHTIYLEWFIDWIHANPAKFKQLLYCINGSYSLCYEDNGLIKKCLLKVRYDITKIFAKTCLNILELPLLNNREAFNDQIEMLLENTSFNADEQT